jgi:hypothetical protein
MSKRNFICLVALGLFLMACAGEPPAATPHLPAAGTATVAAPSVTPEPTQAPSATPTAVPAFIEALVPLALAPEQLVRLRADGVVAGPGGYPEFHDLYIENVSANLPIFVTSDALLHIWHILFDQTLQSLEESVFLPDSWRTGCWPRSPP